MEYPTTPPPSRRNPKGVVAQREVVEPMSKRTWPVNGFEPERESLRQYQEAMRCRRRKLAVLQNVGVYVNRGFISWGSS